MATKKVNKYQQGGTAVPKGMVKGEMTGKLYSKSDMDSWQTKQAAALTKQAAAYKKPSPSPIPSKKMGGSIGKTPSTPAEKKFAALAPPKNKITFADKVTGAKKKK
jgi:hypothetical protein